MSSLPACKYGANCYQKNPTHLAAYSHPKADCKYGVQCYNKSPKHHAAYEHPKQSATLKKRKRLLDSDSDDEEPAHKINKTDSSQNIHDTQDEDSSSDNEIASFEESSSEDVSFTAQEKKPTKTKEEITSQHWQQHKTIRYYNPPESNDSGKIAAFDMDTTLIVPKSGKTHPQGRSDWKWMFDCVPAKLAKLHKNGYKIVIISNQKGISTGKTPATTIQGKILDLQKDCGTPLSAILATSDDEYRKPSPKMFHFCIEEMITVPVDMSSSYYIGDAAGRPVGWKEGKKKDFGCSDRKFALNAELTFQTPEEYFLKEDPVDFEWRGVNPKQIKLHKQRPFNAEDYISDTQEVILFVGFPASGKSTFALDYLIPNGYEHVNRDTLNTQAKCLKATKEALSNGKSVVIDNTNPSPSARSAYINAAKNANVPIRCFHFQTDLELAKHLNNFREIISQGERPHVPGVGFNMFKKHFQEPRKSEGFSEIRKIEFKRYHPTQAHKKLFEQWTERPR